MAAERENATEQEPERIDEDDESEQLERVDAVALRVDGGERSERADTEGDRTDDGAAREDRRETSNEQQREEPEDGEQSPPKAVGEEMDE
ncbi:hypothetical protein BRD03_00320 [Halobacteriales archaeon QS_9_68_17]|nr:MAG: hypothetical protein BRD03_00320 [Halobacteriales archaeon QS_9_68_17]